jgi:hypothetical protein
MNKSIYGLKQAPKAWYDVLNKSLMSMEFVPLQNEPCIFIYTRDNGEKYFLYLYVDDTLIAGKDQEFLLSLVRRIEAKHEIKVIGIPKFILGLSLNRCNNGNIIIDQNQYIKDIAARFDVVSNPNKIVRMPCTAAQFKRIEEESKDESLIDMTIDIRSMVGSLMYASLGTRPDITYFVNYISRYLTKPTVYIKRIVLQAINYLLDTPFIYIICFHHYNGIPQLVTFVDAGHASEANRKGTTGNVLKFGMTPVVWNSSKQSTYSLSTAETEYKALSETIKETLYLLGLYEELGLKQIRPSRMYEDNTATIAMSNHPMITKKSKHIELAVHHFKQYVQNKTVQLFYVASKNQEADLLTKIVASMELFYSLIKKLFSLNTIQVPSNESNVTFMINSINAIPPAQPTERYMNLLRISNHCQGAGLHGSCGRAYHISDECETNHSHAIIIREHSYKSWCNDEEFALKELVLLANIMEAHLIIYSKDYHRFFPYSTECDFNFNIKHERGYDQLKEFHYFMDENVYSIQLMRKINSLLKHDSNPDRMFTRAEIETFIIADADSKLNSNLKQGSCSMIRSLPTYKDLEEAWLQNDSEYKSNHERVDTFNISNKEKDDLYEMYKKRSLVKFEKENNEWLKNNSTFKSQVNKVNNNERLSKQQRQDSISNSRTEALSKKDLKKGQSVDITPEEYIQTFPITTQTTSEATKPSNLSYSKTINKSQDQKHYKPELKRLHRNRDDPSYKHPAIERQPEPKHVTHHSRLTETEKHEFIHLVHMLYPAVYTTILTQLAFNNKMFDSQARQSNSKEYKQSATYKKNKDHDNKRPRSYERDESEETDEINIQFESDEEDEDQCDDDIPNKDNEDNIREEEANAIIENAINNNKIQEEETEAVFENENNKNSNKKKNTVVKLSSPKNTRSRK